MDDTQSKAMVECCVKNCRKKIPIENALLINGKYFCKVCGVQYYRNLLKLWIEMWKGHESSQISSKFLCYGKLLIIISAI